MTDKHTKEVIEFYDEIAEDYASIRMDVSVMQELIDLFLQNLEENKILDVGCGPGRDAKYFSEQNKEVIAIDVSDKFLKIAKKNAPDATILKMDLRELAFPENTFDGLWVCASLLCIEKKDVPQALKGFCKVLKKDGLIFICVKQSTRLKQKDFQEFYEVEEFENMIKKAGFEIMETSISETENNVWINVFARKI